MNLYLYKHEFKLLVTSKKNLFFLLFLLTVIFIYVFIVLPNEKTTESLDVEAKKEELIELRGAHKIREENGATGFLYRSGIPLYALNERYLLTQSIMVKAIEEKNFERYARTSLYNLEANPASFNENFSLFEGSPFPGKDLHHLYLRTVLTYYGYFQEDIPITYKLIEEKTALQVLKNLFLSPFTLLIIFCVIYFSSDLLLRDRHNVSVLRGLPISWYQLMNIKSLAAFIYTQLILVVMLLVLVILLSLQNGFGHFNIQVPIMLEQRDYNLDEFMPIWQFLLMSIIVIPILSYLFIRINLILNLLLKNEWLVLTVGGLFLFSESIYFSRTLREIMGIDISFFPQTYFDFGKIITGDKNFLVNLESITYLKGLIVLLVTIFIVEILVFFTVKLVTKRRFYHWN